MTVRAGPELDEDDFSVAATSAALSSIPSQAYGLSGEQLQRLSVAQRYWPADFAEMSGALQRQVIAEATQFALTGQMRPSSLFGDELHAPPAILDGAV